MDVQKRPRNRIKLEGVVLLANTILLAFSFILMGEEFYIRWWNAHLINRIAGILLVPVAILASFFLACFLQAGVADRGFRVFTTILGIFWLGAGLWTMFANGLSWASIAEGDLVFWGLPVLLAACLGKPRAT